MDTFYFALSIGLGFLVLVAVGMLFSFASLMLEHRTERKRIAKHNDFEDIYAARRYAVEAEANDTYANELIRIGYQPVFDAAKACIAVFMNAEALDDARCFPDHAYTVYRLLELLSLPVHLDEEAGVVELTESVPKETLSAAMTVLLHKETMPE